MTDIALRAASVGWKPARLGRLATGLLAAFALAVGLSVSADGAKASGPAEFLQAFSDKARTELTAEVSAEDRRKRFEEMLDQGFALREVSQFILARYWRAASDAERDAFVEVFKDYLAQRFLPLFDQAGNFTLQFGQAQQPVPDRPDLFEVPVAFVSSSGGSGPVNTVWRVRQENGGYRILDVRAEGTSMAITLRDEYSSVIRRTGSVQALIDELRRLIETGQVTAAGQG